MTQAIIIHGGAWAIPTSELAAHERGVQTALAAGWHVLQSGGSALDAAQAAVEAMENDPTFDAGIGSFLNADGHVEMDAAIMDGSDLNAGAVAAISRVQNPIRLARHVLAGQHVLVVGQGAESLAAAAGIPLVDPLSLVIPRERERWTVQRGDPSFTAESSIRGHDTVGALALDAAGNVAAAISTGGTPNKLPGRVGDSPLIGCGFYADNELGACCATGWGEGIMRVVLARQAVDLLVGETPAAAARMVIERMAARVDGSGGCITLDRSGRIGFWHNTPHMAFGYRTTAMEEPVIGTTRPATH
ncbi:MAG: isoaspartyl peptidase/L-asparaginase [Herpetosiphon sp.]